MSTLVIIPTYQERDNVERIIAAIRQNAPEVDILIADDNSPDGTGEIADHLAASDDHIKVLHRAGKEGLGAAYRAGFAWALARDYQVICEMDADGSHRPEDLPRLLAASRPEVALVIGSRWVKGGKVVNWPKKRELLSRGASLYVRILLSLGVKDATAGFRAFNAEALRRIDLDGLDSAGYCFQIDMTRQVKAIKGKIVEVPITFVERQYGASKMSGNIISEALIKVAKWGLKFRLQQIRALGCKLTGKR